MADKDPGAFRTISEVAADLDLPQHVLRFWETKFNQIRPMKRSGGRRFYRPEDIALVRLIRDMLYGQGYTIRGVQRILKERGARALLAEGAANLPPSAEVAANLADVLPLGEDEADGAEPPREGSDLLVGQESARSESMRPDQVRRLRTIEAELRECASMLEAARN